MNEFEQYEQYKKFVDKAAEEWFKPNEDEPFESTIQNLSEADAKMLLQKALEDKFMTMVDEWEQGKEERISELYAQLCNHHWRHYHEEDEDGLIHTSDASRKFATLVMDFMDDILGEMEEDE